MTGELTSTVRDTFGFLKHSGFTEVEASSTQVIFRKGDIELDVYRGRQSYEVSLGIAYSGTRYAFSEILRALAPELGKSYRNRVATTQEQLAASIQELARLFKQCGGATPLGDPHFPFALESGRKKWAQSYALDILEEQVRPKAEDAFRRGDYSVATNLYESIQERLSRAEAKKLSLARKRSARDAKEILPVTDRPGCDV